MKQFTRTLTRRYLAEVSLGATALLRDNLAFLCDLDFNKLMESHLQAAIAQANRARDSLLTALEDRVRHAIETGDEDAREHYENQIRKFTSI